MPMTFSAVHAKLGRSDGVLSKGTPLRSLPWLRSNVTVAIGKSSLNTLLAPATHLRHPTGGPPEALRADRTRHSIRRKIERDRVLEPHSLLDVGRRGSPGRANPEAARTI